MIGQGGCKSSSPPPAAAASGYRSGEMLACSSFDTPTSPPPLANSVDRRPSTKTPHPSQILKCPRCESLDTKFCYYNNYSLTQPRYFCKNCKRYWTAGGALRNVPVGGGLRKNKRSKLKLAAADADAVAVVQAFAVQQQYQAKVPAPVARAPVEITAETLKNNHAASINTVPPGGMSEPKLHTFDLSRRAHSSRISSSGDHNGAATLDYGGSAASENGGAAIAAASSDHHPGSSFYGEARHLPQFYSSYSTILPSSHQYSNEAPSYVVNYNFLPSSNDNNLLPNDAAGPSPSANYHHNDGANPMISGKPLSSNEVKQERNEGTTTNHYDWQLISEGLFNGGGDGFLYGGNWPDFSQFNDTGPG